MITYPSWYQGGCRDIEKELKNLCELLLKGVTVVSWLPPDYVTQLANGVTYLRVFRLGGQLNIETRNWVDQARVQLAALAQSRDEAWELIIFVREILYAGFYQGGRIPHELDLSTAFMQTPGEVVGPQLLPELMRDERLVAVTFDIYIDRPRSLPHYRDYIWDTLKGANGS